jgi:anti-sigma factor RsiW
VNHLGDLLSALIDGELTGTELDRANAHLAACADCRTEAAELRQLKRALHALAEAGGADAGVAGLSERLLALDNPGRAGRPGRPGRPGGDRILPAGLHRDLRRRLGLKRRTRVIWGALSLMVVGIGAAAFAVGGSSGPSGRQITPQFEVFDIRTAITTGQVPFDGPAGMYTEIAQPLETPQP